MKPTVPEVLPLVKALYARDSAGCCWHVVLDDRNPQCVDSTAAAICAGVYCGDAVCRQLAELLPLMSRTQVLKLAAIGVRS